MRVGLHPTVMAAAFMAAGGESGEMSGFFSRCRLWYVDLEALPRGEEGALNLRRYNCLQSGPGQASAQ